jgi:peroxiredoxin Q/BCP
MPDKTVTLDRKVPEFSLPATGGDTWKLSSAAGRRLVVYFYPKDNTSGCTAEGISFMTVLVPQAGTDIVGVSPDTSPPPRFAKYSFFELLARTSTAYLLFDVICNSMCGQSHGVERSTSRLTRGRAPGVAQGKVAGHAAAGDGQGL